MQLTRDEEEALAGKNGEALASAYRILVAIGEATGAQKLVPIKWAHVSGVNYNTIGDAGAQFLDKFSRTAKVAVRTTVNPMGYDRSHPEDISSRFQEKQSSILKSYERMGVTPSFTCTPYEVFSIPQKGTAVSFAESNAAVFSNSLLGLMTNKESALSALASSVTGKAPLSDLRMEEARNPTVGIESAYEFGNELDYGLLGYFAGKVVKDSSVAFGGISRLSTIEAKALSAAIGTSGSCGMFTLGDAKEKISFGKKEAKKVMDELNTAEEGDIITLGSPQLGLEEMADLSSMLKGRSFSKRCMVFCPRVVQEQARKIGYTNEIERAGCEILSDCCTCLTPLVDKDEIDSVTTNSIKGAYYLKSSNGVDVNLKPLSQIIKDETK